MPADPPTTVKQPRVSPSEAKDDCGCQGSWEEISLPFSETLYSSRVLPTDDLDICVWLMVVQVTAEKRQHRRGLIRSGFALNASSQIGSIEICRIEIRHSQS